MARSEPDIVMDGITAPARWACQTCARHGAVRRLSFGWRNEGSDERHEETIDLCPFCVDLLEAAIKNPVGGRF